MSGYNLNSIFDLIGPEMIGPSSSHTAGAVRLGNVARSILNSPLIKVKIILYNSFAETGKGHGTIKALLAGLLGFDKSDVNIKRAEEIAKEKNLIYTIDKDLSTNDYPPNSVLFKMFSNKLKVEVFGASIGGGLIKILKIDDFEVNITGENETLIVTHRDRLGILSEILTILAKNKYQIVNLNSFRSNKLEDVKSVIHFDTKLNDDIKTDINKIKDIVRVRIIHKIEEKW